MPERARVFVGADSPLWIRQYQQIIEAEHHQVVLHATSVAEVLRQVPTFTKQRIQVAVLDFRYDEALGTPGTQEVVNTIRETAPGVKIIKMPERRFRHLEGLDLELVSPALWLQVGFMITKLEEILRLQKRDR